MRVAGLLALFVAVAASATASDSTMPVLAARNCARLPSAPDPRVRDQIYRVALNMRVNRRVMLAMMATAIVETWVNNLDCGDKDSLGVFQQRPSQGWGTPAQLMDVSYSTRKFLELCIQLEREFPNIDEGSLAQKVQRAEAGNKYTAQLGLARHYLDLAAKSVGEGGPAPDPTSSPDDEPTSTSTRTQTGTGSKPSSSSRPTSSPASTPKSTPDVIPGPPLATLWSPPSKNKADDDDRTTQPTVVQVVLMPSSIVGRADPESDGGDTAQDRVKATACERAEYARPGDSCKTFAERYKLKVKDLRSLNPILDAECLNLDVHRAWCIEEAE